MRRGEQGPQGTEVGKIQKMGEGSKREPSEYKWHNREMQKGGKGEGDKYRRRRELGRITLRMSEKPTVNHTINYLPIYACIHACMHTHIRMHVLPNAWQWAQTCTLTHTKHIYSQHTLKSKNKTTPPFFQNQNHFLSSALGGFVGDSQLSLWSVVSSVEMHEETWIPVSLVKVRGQAGCDVAGNHRRADSQSLSLGLLAPSLSI